MPAFVSGNTISDLNGLLTHTTEYIEKKGVLQDAIFESTPLFKELKERGKIRTSVSGGYQEQVNLMYGMNETFGSYKGYDVLNNDPQDGMTSAFFPWSQYSITISIDGRSVVQNSGPGRVKDLLQSKFEQATMTIADRFSAHLWDAKAASDAETGNSGKNILSVPMLVDADPDRSTTAVGGLNPSTYSWWENQALDYGGTHTAPAFRQKLVRMYNECMKQGAMGGPPDLVIMDQYAYENYELATEFQKRYSSSGKVTAGFEDMYYKGAKVLWDPKVPDPEYSSFTGANYDSANWADGAIYFLNTNFLNLRVLGGRDWKFSKWTDQIEAGNNQDAMQTTALWMGQLVTTNRRKHGVIYGVTDTVISESA
jgi:hypothetical protein